MAEFSQQTLSPSRTASYISMVKPSRTTMISLASVLAFLLLWAVVTGTGLVSKLFLPSPGEVAQAAMKLVASGGLWVAILSSSVRVFLGFLLAIVIAVPLGVAMAVNETIRAVFAPFISLLRPLPSITWIPLTILWLGIGEGQKVLIVFLGSWIYVLLSTYEATRRVDPILIRAARNLGASDFTVMREVIFPGALPGILGGLKVTLAIAWSCVLSAEMVAARNGLGAIIWEAKEWGDMTMVLVGMVCISLTVLVADLVANKVERLLLPWERHRR
ncbi:ABC transporter permease subunit [Agrobacterium vitis]|uniref:ABC transporter permease subunit n=2 Tax=Agrobacterium vitis TaxID=373 RepID=A0A368NX12_AGRVI|nr:ABC transporter permease [Agrobacterium vitis]KAA3513707.1 ABC transporter permease subunit [Agrobacterium vitis]KAA3528288.1 ABC transporter permease subunit [Agrobacterium vitis]MUO68775.1 ABC transporter permease subunit [Agrobacterium vitis]MUO79810.1 ABC transporter permease subunit [Agrobacterium vitis]MUO93701.1 ABC transporter permease subunit [Agrobacterium vitis]